MITPLLLIYPLLLAIGLTTLPIPFGALAGVATELATSFTEPKTIPTSGFYCAGLDPKSSDGFCDCRLVGRISFSDTFGATRRERKYIWEGMLQYLKISVDVAI